VPFAALTLGYLALRLALFGEVVRESQLNAQGLRLFFTLADRHLARVVVGDPDGSRLLMWLVIAVVVAVCLFGRRQERARTTGVLLFFGPVWWILGVAPVAVAGYESPRHVYLASMAWAMLIAVAFDAADRSPEGRARQFDRSGARALGSSRVREPRSGGELARRAGAGIVVAVYALLLVRVVSEWHALAAVSQRATQQLAREARVAPPGALVVVGVPGRSWEWALPFAVRPPFASADLTSRVFIVSPRELHCCRQQWFEDTRRSLRGWMAGPGNASVAVVIVDKYAATGRISSSELPSLPAIARTLADVDDVELLDQGIRRLLDSVSAGR
jgi:hypothetical protein